jgi:hypothetical protein
MLSDKHPKFSDIELKALIEAIESLRSKIQWKKGKNVAHLNKRIKLNHLPVSASLSDYEMLISDLARNEENVLYVYEFANKVYYGVRGFIKGQENEWLVIFGVSGIVETAFPPENMDEYLESRGFVLIGRIVEVLKWT